VTRNESSRPLACVIGEIDLVRSLGLAGIQCAVVSPPGDFTRYSRFAQVKLPWADSWRAPEELVEILLAFGRAQPDKPVLYYNGDWHLLVVSRFREQLEQVFRFVVPDPELVEDLVDKSRFLSLSERLDLPVPRSRTVAASDEAPELGELRYPLVLKPLTRLQETWSPLASAKVIQLDTPEELADAWPQVARAGVEVMIQEAIPGPESLIESYHAYVDSDGDVAAEFTGRKLRTYPARHGYSTALVVTAAADVAELGRDILRRIGFRGVAKVDFKRDPLDGSLHLLEINPRFNLWHHLGARAGVNLPEIVYRDLVGLPRPELRAARPGTRWISPWRDLVAARGDGIGILRWLPWAISCEAKCAISWDDPLAFVGACAYRARRRLSRGAMAHAG